MWIITKKTDENYKRLLLTNREHTIGRADTDLIIPDCSVSRLHARIIVSYPEKAVEDNGMISPVMRITDLSRFGTFINTIRLNFNVPTEIPPNSEVTFGAQPGVTFRMEMSPLNVIFSSISQSSKQDLRPVICALGGKIFSEWSETCSLLIMSRLIVTQKVLCCLLRGINIVTPEYLHVLKKSPSENFSFPDPYLYVPPIEEKGFSNADAIKFRANSNRCHIFVSKTFIFLSKSKFQRFNLLLTLANAKSICVPEDLTLSRQYFVDLFSSESDPCLVFQLGCRSAENELAYSVLKEQFNRRPILDQEISLAIINSSCDVYCNAALSYSVVTKGSLLNAPIGYSSWNIGMSSPIINRLGSTFKRQREDSGDGDAKSKIVGVVQKRQRGRTIILPPSTLANLKKKSSRVLFPGTGQISTGNSSSVHGFLNEKDQSSPRAVSMVKAFCETKNPNEKICIKSNVEIVGDDPALGALDSLPSLVSILKKEKFSTSNVKVLASKTVIQKPIEKNDAAPTQFSVSPNEISISSLRDPQFSSTCQGSTLYDKENAASTNYEPPQSLRVAPTSIDGFLSKATGRKMASEVGGSEDPEFSDVSVNIKLCQLIKDPSSYRSPKKRTPTECSVLNFKRFVKIWPSCYKKVAEYGSTYRIDEKSVKAVPSVKINLVPYVSESKEDTKWNTDVPTQSGNEDAALINRLFDEITALPRVRLR